MPDDADGVLRPGALAKLLTEEIATAVYSVGSRFPTENELQTRFGVGRHTVREALKLLTEQGLVSRRRKTGSVVLSQSPISTYVHSLRNLRGLLNFAQDTRLDIRHEGFLALEGRQGMEDGRWFRVAGLRLKRADNEPLCWSEILVPDRFAVDRATVRQTSNSVYELVMSLHNLRLDYVEQEVKSTRLPAGLCLSLKAEPGSPALLVRRRYVAHTGATFEVSENLYPADRYTVHSVIRQRA